MTDVTNTPLQLNELGKAESSFLSMHSWLVKHTELVAQAYLEDCYQWLKCNYLVCEMLDEASFDQTTFHVWLRANEWRQYRALFWYNDPWGKRLVGSRPDSYYRGFLFSANPADGETPKMAFVRAFATYAFEQHGLTAQLTLDDDSMLFT